MLSLKKIFFFLSVLISFSISAQKDSTQVDDLKIKGKINVNSNYFIPLFFLVVDKFTTRNIGKHQLFGELWEQVFICI